MARADVANARALEASSCRSSMAAERALVAEARPATMSLEPREARVPGLGLAEAGAELTLFGSVGLWSSSDGMAVRRPPPFPVNAGTPAAPIVCDTRGPRGLEYALRAP